MAAELVSVGRLHARIVAVVCDQGPPSHASALGNAGARIYPVSCTGNLHTSAVELLLRQGAAGVIVFSCPPRDCRGREGPKWLAQRIYHDREAELQSRVDRRRVQLATSADGDLDGAVAAFRAFSTRVLVLDTLASSVEEEITIECEPQPMVTRKRRWQ
jgi:coenzyme F420-reducing hydrogenase delta subunit